MYIKINKKIWFEPANSNVHFEDWNIIESSVWDKYINVWNSILGNYTIGSFVWINLILVHVSQKSCKIWDVNSIGAGNNQLTHNDLNPYYILYYTGI